MKLTAIPRITLGLVSLSVGMLLAFDLLLHLFPSEADTTREVRTRLANSLGIQAAALVQARDSRTIDRTLAAMQSHNPEIVSIGLRRADGALVAQGGDHARRWVAPNAGKSLDAFTIGIMSQERRWGALEIAFRPIHQRALGDWLWSGPTRLFALFSVAGSLVFYLYLRRMLQHLDPSAAVPDRVRGAFDALTEGVLILDPQEHILMANRSFEALGAESARGELVGKKASRLAWLTPAGADASADATPWLTTIRTLQPVRGLPFQVAHAGTTSAKVAINCSPLLDERHGVRGCLVTVDDVTALEQSPEQLLDLLADLATSKQQLEHKNTELEELASRDPLSGCLNRRAFFAGMKRMVAEAPRQGGEVICIMADIDHFKSINDRHGHAVGDEAIQVFARILRGCVRQGDLLGRYGGEEFCVAAGGMSHQRALELAETMRQRVAAERGIGAAAGHPVAISASFGVTSLRLGARSEAELVDQADRAMYLAKQTGRNKVIAFDPRAQVEPAMAEEAS